MENTAAFISGIVDGSVSGNSTPGELALGVNNGAGSNANCILIRSDFDIFLGGASGANRMFQSKKGFIYDHDGGLHPFIGVQHQQKQQVLLHISHFSQNLREERLQSQTMVIMLLITQVLITD